MAEVVTSGGVAFEEMNAGPVAVRVRTPGMQFRWSSVEELPAFEATEPGAEAGGWNEAIAENELEPLAALEAEPLSIAGIEAGDSGPVLMMPDSEDAFVDLRAQPLPGESLLVMVEVDGVVQWFAPENAEQVVAPQVFGIAGDAAPVDLQFRIPRTTLAPQPAEPGLAGFNVVGVGRSIVRFFRVKIVDRLIGATTRVILDWIVDQVEKRAKPREGFRFFNRDAGDPFCTPQQLAALRGRRVLLLTHGIFSSLAGAFAGINDPQGAVLQHLRGIYGENIIGWDHWTVGKTPLENATEMLAALPPDVQLDIVSHSRGGLVTRAMLEHPDLIALRTSRFATVGKVVFVAGALQGSQLATLRNLNRLLNIYSAIASFPLLGGAGIVLKVIVGVLRLLANGASRLPSIEALSADVANNRFITALNDSPMTPSREIVVVHANYDPRQGPLARFLDLNVDLIFGQANDMVVPFIGAKTLDAFHQIGPPIAFGTTTTPQGVVMHTNFFRQSGVHDLLRTELQ